MLSNKFISLIFYIIILFNKTYVKIYDSLINIKGLELLSSRLLLKFVGHLYSPSSQVKLIVHVGECHAVPNSL